MDTILLNAMFVGTYGEKNIDGEIINFYLDDDDVQNYFVSEYGTLPEELKNDTIKAILMISKIDGSTFEIIGKYVPGDAQCFAFKEDTKKSQEEEITVSQNIKYSKVPLADICPIDASISKQFVRVSFRGGKVFFINPKNRMILSGKKAETENYFDCKVIQVDEYASNNWGSRNYRVFSGDGSRCYKNAGHEPDSANTYNVLSEIVDDRTIWTEGNTRVTLDIDTLDKIRNVDYLGLNHIIKGAHVELLSSNWLAHYIEMVPDNFVEFFGLSNPGEFISVKREAHNIDILVEFENAVVVIENKIKANIVEKSKDEKCQLEKYYDLVENNKIEKTIDCSQKDKKYILLCPDYQERKIKKQIDTIIQRSEDAITEQALNAYAIKKYSELNDCCLKHSPLSHAKYYTDLLDFIDDHSNVSEHYQKKKLSEKRFLHTIALKL